MREEENEDPHAQCPTKRKISRLPSFVVERTRRSPQRRRPFSGQWPCTTRGSNLSPPQGGNPSAQSAVGCRLSPQQRSTIRSSREDSPAENGHLLFVEAPYRRHREDILLPDRLPLQQTPVVRRPFNGTNVGRS
ncbi:unnamed protein product [Victoria cruziana]